MNAILTITLDPAELARATANILRLARDSVRPVQAAMTNRYLEIVRGNFGGEGVDRPEVWAPLSAKYAQRVKRSFATLFVSGRLEEAIHADPQEGVVSVSSADVPYALAHQFGNPSGNLPARPYFPMTEDGEPLDWTRGQIEEAAQNELASILGGGD